VADVVGVVGAGTMGAGIAQVALEAGCEVRLHDVDRDAVTRAQARIAEGLARRVAKRGLVGAAARDAVLELLGGLAVASSLHGLAAEADLVIEAAMEDLALKQGVFEALDAASRPHTILATNTSALSVGAIAAATARPGRVIGLHFFNPAAVMRLVEVVAPTGAEGAVIDAASARMIAWGKTPVRCSDAPGFIVNRVNRPFTLEALRILEEGLAPIEVIDAAVRADGFPMGPFELMDLIGIDVNLAAAKALFEAFAGEQRFRASPFQERLVAEGLLGRKTGAGFYRYDGAEGRLGPTAAFESHARASIRDPEIVDRIVLGVVNEAFHALGEHVAAASDIDVALRLGAGHPVGPFERVERLGGAAAVADRLIGLAAVAGPRFAPAPALIATAGPSRSG
jgi:3-hydroxybutyryl-CoA dehydrogenase